MIIHHKYTYQLAGPEYFSVTTCNTDCNVQFNLFTRRGYYLFLFFKLTKNLIFKKRLRT